MNPKQGKNMFKKLLPAACCALVLVSNAHAQDAVTIVPGSEELNTSRIAASVDSFTINNYREGKLWRTGKLVRVVERVTENGRTMLRQSQTYDTPDGITVDTTWVDANTLAPVRYFAEVYGDIQKFTFDGKAARGTVIPKDSTPRDTSFTAETPFFNFVALDLVTQALRFVPGAAFKFSAYNPPMMTLDFDLKYVGREQLPLVGGGTIDAIRVTYIRGTHLWLDANDGRLLINGGGRGGAAFWKVRNGIDASALIEASLAAPAPGGQ